MVRDRGSEDRYGDRERNGGRYSETSIGTREPDGVTGTERYRERHTASHQARNTEIATERGPQPRGWGTPNPSPASSPPLVEA